MNNDKELRFVEYTRENLEEELRLDDKLAPPTGGGEITFYSWNEATEEQRRANSHAGDNSFWLLPPWSEKGLLFWRVWTHYGVGEAGKIRCGRMLGRGASDADALCKFLEELDEDTAKKYQQFSARYQMYCNVIDYWEPNRGPQVLRVPRGVYSALRSLLEDDRVRNITNPKEAVPVRVLRLRTGPSPIQVKYSTDLLPMAPRPIHDDLGVVEEWLSNLPQLDKIFPEPTQDDLSVLEGVTANLRRGIMPAGGQAEREGGSGGYRPPSRQEVSSQEGPSTTPPNTTDSEIPPPQNPNQVTERPECFGVKYNYTSRECIACPHDFDCQMEFEKSRKT